VRGETYSTGAVVSELHSQLHADDAKVSYSDFGKMIILSTRRQSKRYVKRVSAVLLIRQKRSVCCSAVVVETN